MGKVKKVHLTLNTKHDILGDLAAKIERRKEEPFTTALKRPGSLTVEFMSLWNLRKKSKVT